MRIEYPERSNEAVRRIQLLLEKLAFLPVGSVDGSWGATTRGALAEYASSIGWARDRPNPSSVEDARDGVLLSVIIPDGLLAELESDYAYWVAHYESLHAREVNQELRRRAREERQRAEAARQPYRLGPMPARRQAPESVVVPVLVGGAMVGLALWLGARRRRAPAASDTQVDLPFRFAPGARADEVQF